MVAGTTEGARAAGAGRCGAQARSACFPGALVVGGCTSVRPFKYDDFLVVLQRRGLLRGCGGCEGGDAFTPFGGNRGGEEITTAAVAAGRQSTKSLCKAKKGCFPGGSADAVGGGEEALVAAHASVGEEAEDEGEDEESDAAEEDGSGVVVGSG